MAFRDLVHVRPVVPVSLELPDSLRTKLVETHGPEVRFELPADYAAFIRETGGGFQSANPNEWRIHTWATALAQTEGVYAFLSGDAPEEEIVDAREGLRRAGVWLLIGAHWRHDHYLCCDPSKPELGRVYDINDGDPSGGLVYDARYDSFTAYLGG